MKRIDRRSFLIGAGSVAFAGQVAPRLAAAAAVVDLDESIAAFAADTGVAGVSACAMNGGEVVWQGAGGWADIAKKVPMTPDTVQNIASISKTVTATAVMQLVESDRLKLKADVNEYLPYRIRNPRHRDSPITIRQLLTHISSIQDGPAYGDSYSCGDPIISLNDWIVSVLTPEGSHYHPQHYFGSKKPGERRQYSNIGYGLLGLIVESVSGKPFNEYCRDHIFAPLGMDNTGWRIDEIDTGTHATLYVGLSDPGDDANPLSAAELPEAGFSELCLYSFPNYPDGLVRTSVEDFGRYMAAYQSDTLLEPKTIKRMLRKEVEISADSIQGLCWVTRDTDRGRTWYHSGGDPGVSTIAAFEPDTNAIAIIFATGTGSDGMVDLLYKLLGHARHA
jgi:CubicO group peptidase (beta-lactamase class C family)